MTDMVECYQLAKRVVDKQANDEGLWFVAQTAPEAYLQQELRRLHAAIEGQLLLTPEELHTSAQRNTTSTPHQGAKND